jgi:hypothetical protein
MVALLTLGLLAAPLAAGAQQAVGKVYRIGILYASTGFDPNADPMERGLIDGIRDRRSSMMLRRKGTACLESCTLPGRFFSRRMWPAFSHDEID